jgi:single-stranded-DNA-specific exonuclease
MTYRWDLCPVPQDLRGEVMQEVGKYAAKLLALRGIKDMTAVRAFLFPEHYLPTSALSLPDMAKAVDRIQQAKLLGERILIWGDFDCDGVTSTALLLCVLKSLGFDVHFTIPLRSQEGHGLNSQRLRQVIQELDPKLIITVDCGVSNHIQIEEAKTYSIDVIVTDHHLLPDPLPDALAVVNPLRLDPDHPLRFLPGVGVAYKLAEALYDRFQLPNVEQFLDLVVIGIIADVAVLQRECRYLVQKGLSQLVKTPRPGLGLLLAQEVRQNPISAQTVAFQIAPKLNAIGRLEDARLAVDLLTTLDPIQAQQLIHLFVATNEERKEMTTQVVAEASQQVDTLDLKRDRAIVLSSPNWHQGVIGIAAARLVETYGCPTVLISIHPETGEGHGSGRSIPGVNLAEAITQVSELLIGGGGHPMAAGFRVKRENLSVVQLALVRELALRSPNHSLERELKIDIALDLRQLSDPEAELESVFRQLLPLEPFGQGNPRPIIALLHFRPSRFNPDLSRNGKHLYFKIGSHRLWYWGEADRQQEFRRSQALDIAFQLDPQEGSWRGLVKDVRVSGEWCLQPPPKIDLTLVDQRQVRSGEKLLEIAVPDTEAIFTYTHTAQVPDPPIQTLILKDWPWLPDELQFLLQKLQPVKLVLAARQKEIPPETLALLLQSAAGGLRPDFDHLISLDLPASFLIAFRLQHSPPDHLARLFAESRAFHEWLDTVDERSILKLCQRLMTQYFL